MSEYPRATSGRAMRSITPACISGPGCVFVLAHMTPPLTLPDLLQALREPTRLRILNCLTAAPLFVSDLVLLLEVPQPTVSRHLRVLRELGLVRDTPIAQFVLYRLRRPAEPLGRVLSAALEASQADPTYRTEREQATERSRRHARTRTDSTLEERPA